jgi:TonB-linked SusC/RagA family outer membrane protein
MYKNFTASNCGMSFRIHFNLLKIMKLTSILLLTAIMQVSASTYAQKVTLRADNLSLEEVIEHIQLQSGFDFIYSEQALRSAHRVSMNVKNLDIREVIKRCMQNQPLTYVINQKTIVIKAESPPPMEKFSEITGRVTDEAGLPLVGASIRIKGADGGTMTDVNGRFSINASGGQTLVITYLGYKPQEVTVTDKMTLNITLTATTNALAEIVVSYGKQKSREITGSIATVDASKLQDMPVGQFAQQLQGKVAGVQIAQSSGQPGRGMQFRIRGAASLFSNTQPLFVIDGMPVTGDINNINPSEIETLTVLKDASASALYGSRAANGVILITTKHAKSGDSKIQFNANYGLQSIPKRGIPEMMNGTEFAQFMREIWEDKVKYENLNPATTPLDAAYQDPAVYGEGTNWFHELTQTAPIQSYDFHLLSSKEKSSSAIIAGYKEQSGVIINTSTKLFSLRFNHDMSLVNNKLKVGFNLAPSYRLDHNNRLETDGANALIVNTFTSSPLFPAVYPDGTMPKMVNSPGMVNYLNPYAEITSTIDNFKTTRILGNAFLNYTITEGLTLKNSIGVDKEAEYRNRFIPSFITLNSTANGLSSATDSYSWTAETNLNYNKTFLEHHNIEALIGYSAQKYNLTGNTVSGTGFPSDDVPYLAAATIISGGNSNTTQFSLLSTIARLNYNYKGRYLLSGAIRRDGSSKFGEEKKYGTFPSISAGWLLSEEGFMQKFEFMNQLKIRGSYGITGNNSFGNFVSIAKIGSFNYMLNNQLVAGNTINTLGNSELAWERNKQFDIGFDIEMLNSRISLTYDYYNKISDGLIQDRPLPISSGFSTIKYNIGVFKFWGHEVTLNTVNLQGKLNWNSSFNISFDRNIIKSLVEPGFIRRNNTVTSDYFRQQAGHRLGEFYGFIFDGLYKDAADLAASAKYSSSDVGTIKMRDVNGDGVIEDIGDRTFIGDPTPDFSFGLTNEFSYKNFDLSVAMSGSVGGDILAAMKWKNFADLDGSRVPLKAVADRWRSLENPGSGVYPRTKKGSTALGRSVNSQMVEDGSFLTAKNISLGYKLPLRTDGFSLTALRLFISVQQAFVLTKYSGQNPEINSNGLDAANGIGIDENAYPVPRTFSIGIRSTFK